MRRTLLLAAAVLALSAGQALAKKQLVIVVKGLDNPFFEAINQGCQKWNKENAGSEYECFYTGYVGQGRHRCDSYFAFEREADCSDPQDIQSDDPGNDARC
jgi:hypothetical protein